MALSDYTIGPDNQIYYQGRPLPPELQDNPQIRQIAEQNRPGTGNARATQPSKPGFQYQPRTNYAFGGSPPPGVAAGPPGPNEGQGNAIRATPSPGDRFTVEPPTDYPLEPRTDVGGVPPAEPGGPKVGSAAWDQQRITDMLAANGYKDWQITSATPAVSQKVDSLGEPIEGVAPSYIVNIRNPQTNAIKRITMNRVWDGGDGTLTTTDPGDKTAGYGYQLNQIDDQQAADPNKVGHSNLTVIGTEMWGTNNSTGAFEKVPGAPAIPKDVKGWSGLQQVDDGQGNLIWVGIDPKDGQPRQAPNMPVTPKEATGYGNPYQVETPEGNLVWYGIDPKTKRPVPIPNMPVIKKPPKGPGSITQGNVTYVLGEDGQYHPAPGVPNPNQPAGTPRVKLGSDGFLYQEISKGDGTWDIDPTFEPVAYTDAAKASKTQVGALHKPGEPGIKVIGGKSFPVIYRGGGDDNYDVVPPEQGGRATPYPGAAEPTAITTSTESPYIAQRLPDGSVEWVPNKNYAPTDAAAQMRNLSAQASAKFQEIQAKIGPGYTPEQASSDMDTWWNANIEPAKQQLAQQQKKDALELQLKVTAEQRAQAEQQRANYATAQEAGKGAVEAYKATLPYRVGPGFAGALNNIQQAFAAGKAPGNFDIGSAVTFEMPDLNQLAQTATAQALQHLSPTAAQVAGGGLPSIAQLAPQLDPNALLNRSQYQFQPGAPTPAVAAQPALQQQAALQTNPYPAAVSPAGFKTGWPGSDPRLSGVFNPYEYMG
jgi:hypothetical protein